MRSDVDADAAERVQARVVEVIDRAKGKLVKVRWGRRRLAPAVAKQRRGVYVYVKYVGMGGLVAKGSSETSSSRTWCSSSRP